MLSDADYQALLPFRGAEPYCGELDARQQHLAEQKLIESTIVKSKAISGVLQFYETGWIITVAGQDALSAYEKKSAQDTESKRQQRFQNKVSVASVLVPFITFILGLVVEHYSGLISLLLNFLG